ncbi:MAG: glycosyltransferase family 4 protein [Niastella sp.]|uniref:glycosyltransferase family 4 protein n=1 Tax=Niastella sp. TaxID=1869183 RepID=UPI00389A0959
MKTGILEMEHFEGAYPIIQLFDMPANQVVVFTNTYTYHRFVELFKEDIDRFQWVVIDKTRNRLLFFWRLYKAAKKHQLDLFYVNTISNNHLLYAWMLGLLRIHRVVLTVHDLNCMFRSHWSIKLRQSLHHIGKKALIKRIKEFNVISEAMIENIREATRNEKTIHNLPGSVFRIEQTVLTINNYIHLVVCGALEKKRRDYSQVFDLVKAAEEKQLPLYITLLGGYVDEFGRSIVQKAQTLNTKYARLTVYDSSLVPQDEFDKQLNNAHFILITDVIDTAICFAIPETYGRTKSSGNVFDGIKHARPFIVPAPLRMPANLESSCYRYSSNNQLIVFLSKLYENRNDYMSWQQQALANSKEYTIDKVRARNPALFGVS